MLLAVDLGMEDLVNDPVDAPDAEHDGPSRGREPGRTARGRSGRPPDRSS